MERVRRSASALLAATLLLAVAAPGGGLRAQSAGVAALAEMPSLPAGSDCPPARAPASLPSASPTASPAATPSPAGSPVGTGAIRGRYLQAYRDGEGRAEVFGATIGLYPEAFLPGANAPSPPPPLATATSGPGGRFAFCGLAPGVYYLSTIGEPVVTAGVAVEVRPGVTVEVELVGCLDCPPPN